MRYSSWLLLFACALPAAASEVEYLGSWAVPRGRTWAHWDGGLSYVPDCLGRPDPSPDDGFPGCMLAIPHHAPNLSKVGLLDVAAPGGASVEVIAPWNITGGIERHYREFMRGNLDRIFDVLYHENDGNPRCWFVYDAWFADIMRQESPFLGVASCDPEDPRPEGLWGFPTDETDMLHPNKFGRGLFLVPPRYAAALGGALGLGPGKGSGSRNSSIGPSFAFRPLDVPLGVLDDARVAVAYPSRGDRYHRWYVEEDWPYANLITSNTESGDIVGDSLWIALPAPLPDPDAYPMNAGPCGSRYHSCHPEWRPTYPPPDLPVQWYGVDRCKKGPAAKQQPSFNDYASDGEQMPNDCNIVAECRGGTGPRANNVHLFLYEFAVADLAAAEDPSSVSVLSRRDISFTDSEGNRLPCDQGTKGSTADHARRLLFLASGGARPKVHVYRIHPG